MSERVRVHQAHKAFVTQLFRQDDWTYRQAMVEALRLRHSDARPYLVADVGAGPGCSLERLLAQPVITKVVCIDLHAEMLAAARETVGPHATYVQGDGCHLPLADASVHAVVCSGLLHSVKSQQQLLEELTRVVKGGGRVVVGNKGLPPWMGDSEWYRVAQLCVGEPAMEWPPVHLLPECAADVRLRWVEPSRGFYVLSFRKGLPPDLNLEAVVPGLERSVGELLAPDDPNITRIAAARGAQEPT